jgi:hypothetical protein
MARVNKKSDLKMMFGIGQKKTDSEIVIKVDGKTIKCYEKGFNLRKELIANGFDVYPLKAKITGSCGGNGTDTYMPIFSQLHDTYMYLGINGWFSLL